MKLKGKGFILRRARIGDLASYHENKNDKALDKGFWSYKYTYTKTAAKKDLKEVLDNLKNKEYDEFIIDVRGEVAGEIGLTMIIPKLSAKIHYWIGKKFRGKGIVTRATKLIVNHGFKTYKLRRIYGKVRKSNKASARVLEKSGFKLEGVLRKNFLKYGKYSDDLMYARVR